MRLIDADALIDFIDPEHLRHPDELSFSEVDVVNILNHAPTAYDVERLSNDLKLSKKMVLAMGKIADIANISRPVGKAK